MADASAGLKIPLKISPCTLETSGDIKLSSSPPDFEVMINPSNYSHGFTVDNNKKQAPGQASAETKFNMIKPEKVGFDIVLDGTGVVNPTDSNSGSPDVKTQVEQLKKIVYTYVGAEHSPNYVRLLWGSFIFFGTLESMSMEYTLFKPSGLPLRAKVKLAFIGFQSKEEGALKANRSSPDLDHVVEVKAGDTLPLLCYRIYKDPAYYTAIARVNNLVNFRSLVPGTRLHFPPLR
ncbi:MAG: peptidoglycan-binding protein [Chloroflexi bacterium]|nr:peptidoglycan-binding protein [Chloroflexota bacterium]